ncbi:MAG TPA: ribbon-helix-helix domain-containing protein [Bdellovibrionota bacterium]|nr:ribbon-helix-helix domain-containing protein [Bdellovibrionota bacterium]
MAARSSAKEIFKRVVDKKTDIVDRTGHTFKLSKKLVKDFKRLCKDEGVSMSEVIEEFLSDLLDAKSQK